MVSRPAPRHHLSRRPLSRRPARLQPPLPPPLPQRPRGADHTRPRSPRRPPSHPAARRGPPHHPSGDRHRGLSPPGEQLRDAELEDWLGVSRTPIREALLRLEREGLVDAQPGRRTTVAEEDPERVAQARDVEKAARLTQFNWAGLRTL
ncbi:GntR family transcriptional regulator [Nesterenkonia suensis]